jgi:transcription initiation factor IIE alpha subunit
MEGNTFYCNNCSYRWTNRRNVEPKTCPGCSSTLILDETEKNKSILEKEDIDFIESEKEKRMDLLPKED